MNISRERGRAVRPIVMLLAASCALAGLSCVGLEDLWFNTTSSLGRPTNADGSENDTPGRRADLSIIFKNNTAYRAVFTYGTYDPLNTDQGSNVAFPIKFRQFVVDRDGRRFPVPTGLDQYVLCRTCAVYFEYGFGELVDQALERQALTAERGAPR